MSLQNACDVARSSTARSASLTGMRLLPTETGTAIAASRSHEVRIVAFKRFGLAVSYKRRRGSPGRCDDDRIVEILFNR